MPWSKRDYERALARLKDMKSTRRKRQRDLDRSISSMEQDKAQLKPAYDRAQDTHQVVMNIVQKMENKEIEIDMLAESSMVARERRKKNRPAVDEDGNVDAEAERQRNLDRAQARQRLKRELNELERLYNRYKSEDQIAAQNYDKLQIRIERAEGEISTLKRQLQEIDTQIAALEQQLYDPNDPSSQPPPGYGGGSGGGGSGGGYPSAGGWGYSTFYGGGGHPDYGYHSGGGGTSYGTYSSPQSYSGNGGGKSHQAYPTQKGAPAKSHQVGKSSDKPLTKNSQASTSASKISTSTTTTTTSKPSKQHQQQPAAAPTAAMKDRTGSGATKKQSGPGATTTLPTHPKVQPASSKPASSKPAVQKKGESWHK